MRLTDELALKEQTDEEGDLFNWIKHQAKQGVLSAQVNHIGVFSYLNDKPLFLTGLNFTNYKVKRHRYVSRMIHS